MNATPGVPFSHSQRRFQARTSLRDCIEVEPFFTTKAVGQGTGLGLDTVHRIVRKHKGTVNFKSRPGRTVFRVRLPISSSAVQLS